jgi:DNA-binding response OmpR family regulator
MKKILIIDDSPLQQKLAGIYLSKDDYHVFTANTGRSGIELALTDRPDLIILDVEMPEMDGLETLKLIKVDPTISSIPVLMCSSIKKEEVINKALSLGAKGYINKPHGFKNFNAHIKGIFAETYQVNK